MKKHKIEIVLNSGEVKEMVVDSNDKTTAINGAMNRLDEAVKQDIVSVKIIETVDEDIELAKKKKEAEYFERATKIYEEKQRRKIERIAEELKEEDERAELKKIQDACPHEKTISYNHGYHRECTECGKEIFPESMRYPY